MDRLLFYQKEIASIENEISTLYAQIGKLEARKLRYETILVSYALDSTKKEVVPNEEDYLDWTM